MRLFTSNSKHGSFLDKKHENIHPKGRALMKMYRVVPTTEGVGLQLTANSTILVTTIISIHRELLEKVSKVTKEDLKKAGNKYIAPIFEESKIRRAVCCNPSKITEVVDAFKPYGTSSLFINKFYCFQ